MAKRNNRKFRRKVCEDCSKTPTYKCEHCGAYYCEWCAENHDYYCPNHDEPRLIKIT